MPQLLVAQHFSLSFHVFDFVFLFEARLVVLPLFSLVDEGFPADMTFRIVGSVILFNVLLQTELTRHL